MGWRLTFALAMVWFSFYLTYELVGWGIRVGMVPTVLRRQLTPGASLAWLGIVSLHPYIGLALYLAVGESRLGPRRLSRHQEIVAHFRNPANHPARQRHQTEGDVPAEYQAMVSQAEKIGGLPLLADNDITFLPSVEAFMKPLLADLAAAQKSVHLLYYIFSCDVIGKQVADAVIAASKRGVKCRVLADALASREFFHLTALGPKLIAAGVEVAAALPVTPIRRRLARMDLRNHRKLTLIDGAIAYVGSHNLISADYGGRKGQPWVDLTGRITGPVVGELASVFAEDWQFETGEEIQIPYPEPASAPGESSFRAVAQVVPTGPTSPDMTYRRLLLAVIQSARRLLILTTPYFVPDEPTLLALMMAADRGVKVKLILPCLGDHFFAAAAGRAHYHSLLNGGVEIYLYSPGLIHAKTASVDDSLALFGSANLDVRSFGLNFELSVLLYGQGPSRNLRTIQEGYLEKCEKLNLETWDKRARFAEYADRAVALLSPLL
jgi:cardiolipin synthase